MRTTLKSRLIGAISNMSEDQAAALYHAVAQWVDNTRCHIEDTEDKDVSEQERRMVEAAEVIEAAGDAYLAGIAEDPL